MLNHKRAEPQEGRTAGMVLSTSAARCADTRTRLARLLGMMGSQHDGEALNAARLADKLVREQGITWFNVISTAPPRASPDPPPPPRPSDDDLLMQFESASDACEFVLASTPMLTEWERNFVLRLSNPGEEWHHFELQCLPKPPDQGIS